MVKGCGNTFHPGCATTTKLTANEKADWVCPECKCSIRKQGDYTHTPVGASKVRAANITIRKKPDREEKNIAPANVQLEFPSTEFLEIMSEVRTIRQDMAMVKDMLSQVTTTLARYDVKLETLTTQLSKMHNYSSQIVPVAPPEPLHQTPYAKTEDRRMTYAATTATISPSRSQNDTSGGVFTDATIVNVGGRSGRKPANELRGPDELVSKVLPKDTEAGEWHLVERRRSQRRLTSLRGTAGPDVTSLVAVEHRKHIHLWNMVSAIDAVKAYMQTLCPGATCTVEELKPKGDYKSYKIGVPAAHIETCLSPHVWPENARVKAWFFRAQRGTGQQESFQRTTTLS